MEKNQKQYMDLFTIFIKAIYAGFMIGIGGIIYLAVENKIIGALLFSFGLSTIVVQGFYLFTGKIGFVKKRTELIDMLITIIGNYIGSLIAAVLANAAHLGIDSSALVSKKLNNSVLNIFLLSAFCGVLMFLAIDSYNKTKNIIFVIAPVVIFILSGFEHSVANMFYFNLAGSFNLKTFGYILVMLAGNAVGSSVFRLRPE